jgi:hypothetical protein
MPRHPGTIKNKRKKLNYYDGMSANKSTPDERSKVLEKILDEVSPDCIKYGFYFSPVWDSPVADYNGDCIQNEITLKNVI